MAARVAASVMKTSERQRKRRTRRSVDSGGGGRAAGSTLGVAGVSAPGLVDSEGMRSLFDTSSRAPAPASDWV